MLILQNKFIGCYIPRCQPSTVWLRAGSYHLRSGVVTHRKPHKDKWYGHKTERWKICKINLLAVLYPAGGVGVAGGGKWTL